MHRPSVPADLLPLDRVWAGAVLLHLIDGGSDVLFDGDRVSCPGGGGGDWWWHLRLFPGDRAVLWGRDVDHSYDFLLDEPVDFLAGGPGWLPEEELRQEDEDGMVGYLYWWQGGRWDRAPYPGDLRDDGLVSWVGGVEELCRGLYERFGVYSWPRPDALYPAVESYLERAAARTVDETVVRRLVEAVRPYEETFDIDLAYAMDVVRRAGLGGPHRSRSDRERGGQGSADEHRL